MISDNLLRIRRRAASLSLDRLADLSGVARNSLLRHEQGIRPLRPAALEAVEAVLRACEAAVPQDTEVA